MDVEHVDEPVSVEARMPDSIRITRHGKLRDWVKKALDFFQSQPDRPLVLYSAPADVSTSTIARLVTVVEIIKREYLKGRNISTSDVSGLHQYNQLLYEQQDEDQRSALNVLLDGRTQCVTGTLGGAIDASRNSVKQSYMPHMKVTLSVEPIASSDGRRTYQAPMVRRMSKAAKARMRKRLRKQGDGE